MKELHTLRISVARIAQSMGIDNHLQVTGKNYAELANLASTQKRGWNALCAQAMEHAERIQQDNEDLRLTLQENKGHIEDCISTVARNNDTLRRILYESGADATPEDYAGSYDDPILEDRPRSSFASARECAIDEQADMSDEKEDL